jgi:hypothetical protein
MPAAGNGLLTADATNRALRLALLRHTISKASNPAEPVQSFLLIGVIYHAGAGHELGHAYAAGGKQAEAEAVLAELDAA